MINLLIACDIEGRGLFMSVPPESGVFSATINLDADNLGDVDIYNVARRLAELLLENLTHNG
jgi:hypothetical protein